ncbi:hypothetical protein CT0861_06361 [Colletotrichum tofieldiae]|uniref:Uncharacterized protein n=1 Tax=Colletotrichum tofieldiae TaxID=708197 RepID=A0A166YGE6_9PEZI|nr:hypothetical protein CT0861_06361 [Colletotrichum tofieldiae]GKT61826.1 hypothetical protein ColTof3_09165 [Colletotrichum tofieldiae]
MKGSHATVSAILSTVIGLIQANSDIVSLYTNGVAYIQEASATLLLPELPSSSSGDVAIWSAIMMDNQASFLQGVTSNSPSGLWDQNVYVDGKLVSSVSTSWENVSVVLSEADQSFKHAGSWAHGASGGAMSSPDGGKTWNFDTINIPAQKAE